MTTGIAEKRETTKLSHPLKEVSYGTPKTLLVSVSALQSSEYWMEKLGVD
jgi:hypothetical protein